MQVNFKIIEILSKINTNLELILIHLTQIDDEKEEDVWMDAYEVMQLFNIHRSTLYRWKIEKILQPRKLGKKDLYLKSEIEKAIRG
ncbi:helix-turn-helix domain-containing protein [Pseudopedobacter beijingensis]|uniref:Helix-turn-helix domain-containing protein n=1 Tax=Pseudopedobacter beijingensis TaxID=1207056 RepID=A0ABW4I8F3_9SPHI